MVKNIAIDCRRLRERETAHKYLEEALELPAYYGHNLDALYDCLTGLGECRIILSGAEKLEQSGGYGARILRTIRDAAGDDPHLELVFI